MRHPLDVIALSPEALVAMLVAISFAAGLNVYATVATLGLLGRYGFVTLPGALEHVTSWWVIGPAGALFVVEVFADKIPAFDLVWNVVHTFVRVPVAALMAYAAASPLSSGQQAAATFAGAAIALVAHGGKTATRAAVTLSPEPFSNAALSLGEDAFSIALTWFATAHPLIAGAIAVACVAAMLVFVRVIWRAIRSLVWHAQHQRSGD
jgi:hypothetical protein